MKVQKEIEKHRMLCGPMAVSVNGVCRRKLRESMNSLLDRLTREIHPEGQEPESLEVDEEIVVSEEQDEESDADKKARLIEEGKMKAEVKHEVEKYRQTLQGNSKMLQDQSGKINER